MIERPETKYARSGDVMVAYQVTGEGNAVDLVHAPGTVSHVELFWDIPGAAEMIEQLSSFARLIRFDKRGTGMSDRPPGPATLEERADDIRAVMDAAGSKRAFVFGSSEGGSMACVFAATYPERTSGLILWGTQATWIRSDDYPWGVTQEEMLAEIEVLAEHGMTDTYLFGPGAGVGTGMSEEEMEAMRRLWRSATTPGALAALERMNLDIDIRGVIPSVHVPTLVMGRSGDPVAHVDAARDLASHIEGARFVEFAGDTHVFFQGPRPEEVTSEIQEFVTGSRPEFGGDRALATILFTDIVDSTHKAAELGDRAWRDLIQRHHKIVRDLLARSRGTEMDTAGDGFFATFDGPARAVRCAVAAVEAVRPLGIEIRAGVHTGEVETIDAKAGGIAVVIGARISGSAGASEVLVSSTVKELVAGSGLAFEDVGEHELKGVPDRWRLYRVVG
ncbi:MAG TPA: adenylate/guanylate cyclase domain-containing protein [Actinomycetota bacterium]